MQVVRKKQSLLLKSRQVRCKHEGSVGSFIYIHQAKGGTASVERGKQEGQ